MLEILLLCVLIVLIAICVRSRNPRKHRGLFARKCAHCRNTIPGAATVCEYCHRDVEPTRWIWARRARQTG